MSNLFENIGEKNKDKILKLLESHTMKFPKGIDILSMISGENVVCILDAGTLNIIKNDYNGNRNIIEELNEGDIFGSKMSFIINNSYEVLTKEDSTITIIDYDRIIDSEIIKNDYYIIFLKNLLRIMNEKTKEKNERIEILTKRSIRDKILEYLRIESKRVGANVIYLPFTFTELADYLAVDRSAMTRELKYLKEDGIIDITGKRIKLKIDQK